MPLLKDHYTSEDYWNLPENERAELPESIIAEMLTHASKSRTA